MVAWLVAMTVERMVLSLADEWVEMMVERLVLVSELEQFETCGLNLQKAHRLFDKAPVMKQLQFLQLLQHNHHQNILIYHYPHKW